MVVETENIMDARALLSPVERAVLDALITEVGIDVLWYVCSGRWHARGAGLPRALACW
jgi:hypothetical protein